MAVCNFATGPQQHVPRQTMAPMLPRLRVGLPNSLVSQLVARRVSEGARRASHDCRRIALGYLGVVAEFARIPTATVIGTLASSATPIATPSTPSTFRPLRPSSRSHLEQRLGL